MLIELREEAAEPPCEFALSRSLSGLVVLVMYLPRRRAQLLPRPGCSSRGDVHFPHRSLARLPEALKQV